MTGSLRAIVCGGAACAILDGTAATIQFGIRGIKPLRVWQGVASGVLGDPAFLQGWVSGGLGLLLDFLIAFSAAAIFVAACHPLPFLARAYWVSGSLYGLLVYLVMSLIVVPLSRRPKMPKSPSATIIQLIIHVLFVGLPISIAASRL
jgi:uncharacterized membrane protein SirB2